MKTLAVLLLSATLLSCATSNDAVPVGPPVDSDEFQIEATVLAVYNVISGPAGRRDWRQFEGLFAPGAQMVISAAKEGAAAVTVLTPKEYVAQNTPIFNDKGWFERPIATRTMRYGDIAQVWSTYESRAAASDEKPLARGINSVQLVRIGGAWKVQSIVWQQEDAAHPIPAGYLTGR
jgi:hypothetical protein